MDPGIGLVGTAYVALIAVTCTKDSPEQNLKSRGCDDSEGCPDSCHVLDLLSSFKPEYAGPHNSDERESFTKAQEESYQCSGLRPNTA